MTEPTPHAKSLAHLPLPLFAAPMGIGGLGLAWREAAHVLGAPALVGEAILGLAAIVWLVVAGLHLLRLTRHPEALRGDLRHPVRSAFAGAVTIGLLILSGGLLPYSMGLASSLWLAAVVVHLLIGVWTVRGLLTAPREAATLTPPLLIPLVGNILAPVMGAKMGFLAISWMLFGVGSLLWIMIQPILMWRIVVGPPMPERLKPTLAIFLAPPAVGAVALTNLVNGTTALSLAVYGLAAFTALVLLSLTRQFMRLPFAVSWWGWTFPSAAFAVATLKAANDLGAPWMAPLVWLVLLIATLIIALVSAATLRAALAGHLLQPEG